MSYAFTPEQIAEIQRLFDIAQSRNTNYADVYAYIRDSIPLASRLFDAAVDNSYRWFAGATDANGNVGPFATFIRSYTERQAALRGVNIAGQMQAASNAVAFNAISSILNVQSTNYGILPTIEQIAREDASGVGETLFQNALPGDTAGTEQNAAWSGALLFSFLGSNQSWRLLGASSGSAQLDRVDDLKNLLFAYDAATTAYHATGLSGVQDIASLWNFGPISIGVTFFDFAKAIFSNTTALPYIEMVHWFGPEKLLDALRKITNPNASQDTTSANFAQRAKDLFYGATELGSNLQVQRFDSLDPADLANQAQNDIAYRYALKELNPFAVLGVDYSAHNSNSELSLFDPATGTGELTTDYITDRARFAVLRAKSLETAEPNLFQSVDYFEDVTTNTTIGIPLLTSKFIFGGIENDSVDGGLSADHLYGGKGNDTISGGLGNDYLEGNAGQDTLHGDAGNDVLLGGKDVDILDGGEGNDQLKGGAGVDVYQFNGTYGTDIITDSDGQGFISIDNNPANSGTFKLENIYKNEGTGYTYTKLNGGTSVVISKVGDANRVIINDWNETNNLSINLTGSAPAAPATTLMGDFKKKIDGHDTSDTSDDTYVIENNNYVNDGAQAGAKDLLYGTDSNNVIDGGGGDDYITGEGGDDYLIGGAGNDLIQGGLGSDTIMGGAGDDSLYAVTKIAHNMVGDVNYEIPASPYTHTQSIGLNWYTGYNTSYENGVPYGFIKTWNGNFVNDFEGDNVQNYIDGGAGEDYIAGGQGADYLIGGIGKDLIQGLLGNDILLGGDDNDYIDGDQGFTDEADGNDIIDGGNGDDILHGDGGEDIIFGGADNDKLWGEKGKDFLFGGDGVDQLAGGEDNDYLEGGEGNDALYGEEGDDILIGGEGIDDLRGGAGADTFYVGNGDTYSTQDSEDKIIFLDGGNADDTTASSNPAVGSGGAGITLNLGNAVTINIGDGLVGKSDSTITFADGSQIKQSDLLGTKLNSVVNTSSVSNTLFGGMLDDYLLATGTANSTLFGGLGNDTLVGNDGNNNLKGGVGNDTYVFNLGGGIDTITDTKADSNLIYLGAGIDKNNIKLRLGSLMLDLGNGDAIHIDGFDQNDVFNSSAISTFEFADGTTLNIDQLLARGFDLDGTSGNDTLTGTNTTDRINGLAGNDVLQGGAGDDSLDGGIGNDTLDGGTGTNQLLGGTGDDTYVVDDSGDLVTENALEGTDTVNSSITYTLNTNVENLTLTGIANINGTGNDLDNILTGNSAANTLNGDLGNDTLTGLAGNDTLIGGEGNDQLQGGLGDDTYQFNLGDGADVIDDAAGVNAITFGAGITKQSLQVSQYQGNDGSYYLRLSYGNQGDTVVIKNGLSGSIQQYQFNDGSSISHADLVGTADVPLYFEGTSNADTFYGSNLSDLFDAGDGNDTLNGEGGDDEINGGGGNDTLNGGLGNDTLDGGEGNDVVDGNAGQDSYVMRWGMGQDIVQDSTDGELDTILLDTGINVLDLSSKRIGNDLLISFNTIDDGYLIKNYYAGNQQWQLMDEQGLITSVADFVASVDAGTELEKIYNSYSSAVKSTYFATLGAQGYRSNASGGMQKKVTIANPDSSDTTYYTANYNVITQNSDAGDIFRLSYPHVNSYSLLSRTYTTSTIYVAAPSGNIFNIPGARFIRATSGFDIPDGYKIHSISPSGNYGEISGIWVIPESYTPPLVPVTNVIFTKSKYAENSTLTLENITAGDSANTINLTGFYWDQGTYAASIFGGNAIVDAGAGDDSIIGNGSVFYPDSYYGFSSKNIGALLNGNSGNDSIFGTFSNDVIIGGEGDDNLDGGVGADRYIYLAADTGIDTILDSSFLYAINNDTDKSAYDFWYYRSLGYTNDEVYNLPPAPFIAADDYAALAPLYAAGIIEMDTVEFGVGIDLSSLEIAYDSSDAMLTITWGANKGVRIGIGSAIGIYGNPFASGIGLGIEQFKFADGTILSMAQMRARATIINNAPNVIGAPQQLNVIADSAINWVLPATSLFIDKDPNDTLSYNITNADGSPLPSWLIFNSATLTLSGIPNSQFVGDYTFLITATDSKGLSANVNLNIYVNDVPGNLIFGTEGNDILSGGDGADILVGLAGADTLSGGAGRDQIQGGEGDDNLTGGLGADYLSGDEGQDTYYFNVGDGADQIYDISAVTEFTKIVFGTGITQSAVTYSYLDGDFIIKVGQNVDQINIYGFSPEDLANGLAKVELVFSENNTVVNFIDALTQNQVIILGTQNDDVINGTVNSDVILAKGGNDTIYGGGGADYISGGAGDDVITIASTADYAFVSGDDGNDVITANTTFIVDIDGGAGSDTLNGGSGSDNLYGGSGNDELNGNAGNDYLSGDFGDDTLVGGAGDDTYYFYTGGGHDQIENIATDNNTAVDTLDLGQAILTDIVLTRIANDLLVTVSASDSITIKNYYSAGDNKIDQIIFTNYDAVTDTYSRILWDRATFEALVSVVNVNHDPVAANVITAQTALEDSAFTFTVPANVFTDVDVGDALSYSTTLSDGSALPSWLSFDAATRTFTGTPLNEHVGNLGLKLTATDTSGASANQTFNLTVQNTNDAPIVANVISAQTALEDSMITFTVPANAFTDVDVGDTLTYTTILADGSTLPSWLTFNAATQTFSGTPLNDNVGNLSLKLTATDVAGASISQNFDLTVQNTNEAPTLSLALADAVATETQTFNYTIPSNAFADVDVGDSLTYTVTQTNGAALPSWLSFDAATRTLSGTAQDANIGVLDVRVTATDTAGTSAQDSFLLTINPLDRVLIGTAGNDTLIGGQGNDTIDGGAGIDTMKGGKGNDTYIVDIATDIVTENLNEGFDTIQSSVTLTSLAANVENLTLTGTTAINGTGNTLNNVITGNSTNNTLNGGVGADTLQGGLGNDIYVIDNVGDVVIENVGEGTDTVQSSITYTLGAEVENLTLTGNAAINGTGNDLSNSIVGNTAANILTGGNSNDTLNGGAGADTLIGNAGNDIYVVDNVGDTVIENANEGTDTIQTSITLASLAANVENLTLSGTAAINGTGNELDNLLTGNAANNTLNGGAGNDTLNGGAGADTLIGGLGNDTYTVDSTADVVTESANEGIDLVQASVTYSLAANVESLTLTGTTAINATGNELDNVLTGNSAINTLTAGTGNDTLNGAAGADTMLGDIGNDTYIVDNVGDMVTENADEGIDTIQTSVTLASLSANVENLTLTGTAALNATGNELNNILTGNAGNNILNGGLGSDTMVGGLGNDTYVVDDAGDVVSETSNLATEIDTVQSSISYTLGSNLEKLTLTATSNINGTGNELNNTLTGNTGNNVLDGGLGNDTMVGGLGDDTYIVDATSDIVTEAASAGTDTVLSSAANYTLATNVENLALTGTDHINGTGNTLANTIIGNAGNNILSGGTGADSMLGGAGDDTYMVDNVGDVVTENLNEGFDSVQSSVTYALTANLENLVLTGAGAINATGNALNNALTGNTGNNILDGGLGSDTLIGGLGNDTYVVDDAGDVVTETSNLATEIDTVQSSISFTLGTNLEKLTLTGLSNINATGNELNNTLTGNAGNNTLDGGLGNDTMVGGLGDDTYVVNVATDIVTEAASAGTDNVQSSAASYTLTTNLENLTLIGSDNINGTGNTLANTITGNSGDNIISGGTGADTLIGNQGNDTYIVDNIADTVTENDNQGIDTVKSSVTFSLSNYLENLNLTGTGSINATGNALSNYLSGTTGNNILNGLAGSDILQGLAGNDTLTDNADSNLYDGGAGTDTLIAGAGNDLLIGGLGNDTITTGVGYDIIAFNKGDGADIINASTGADNTISLGGNFAYSDLSLTKTGNNLILKMGTTDQITLKDWYLTSPTNKSVINLQVVAEAIQGFSLGSADNLRNNNIENFNFTNLVAAFDAAGATANWQLTDASLTTHLLVGSDTAAIGGDLAYQYGKNSNLTGMGLINAQSVIAAASFGQTAQTLNNPTVWQAELVKMG